jgi:hypothetical protein
MITTNFNTALLALVNSLTSAEKINFNNLLFEKAFMESDITKSHRVLTGVRDGRVVPILKSTPNYGTMPFASGNDCVTPECDLAVNFSSMKWDLALARCKYSICMESFSEDFLLFFNQTRSYGKEVDLNDAILLFYVQKVKEALLGAQWVKAYFADKTSSSPLLNGMDGFFVQAQANASQIVNITENLGTTYAAQIFSSGQRIYDILDEMDAKLSTQPWASAPGIEIKMTALTANILVRYLNSLKEHDCCNGMQVVNPDGIATRSYTVDNLSFRGMKIVVMQDWSNIINDAQVYPLNQGANARVNPHRILMTYPENLLIGTSDNESLSYFDTWYSKDDDKVYIKAGTYIGAAIPMKNEYILAI